MIDTFLFDFDGVISDTESQYDKFWNAVGKKYFDNPDFARLLKGQTLKNIFENYFKGIPVSETAKIESDIDEFEADMEFPLVKGVDTALRFLKEKRFKTALVTSSPQKKLAKALLKTGTKNLFDTIVSSGDVVLGKPNPQCYLLAAQRLSSNPENCIVFEDALAGIAAGKAANMFVVGVKTSLDEATLAPISDATISDFTEFDSLLAHLKELNLL